MKMEKQVEGIPKDELKSHQKTMVLQQKKTSKPSPMGRPSSTFHLVLGLSVTDHAVFTLIRQEKGSAMSILEKKLESGSCTTPTHPHASVQTFREDKEDNPNNLELTLNSRLPCPTPLPYLIFAIIFLQIINRPTKKRRKIT